MSFLSFTENYYTTKLVKNLILTEDPMASYKVSSVVTE